MTIYTSASRTHKPKYDICADGRIRTANLLDKHGLHMDSLVTMRFILEEMGISDCVFSFCEVRKGDEQEAAQVLQAYMAFLLDLVSEYFHIYLPSKALTKRLQGHIRPEALLKEYKGVKLLRETESDNAQRKALEVYLCLLSDRPEYQAVTHAGIALMDAAELIGKRTEVNNRMLTKLRELLV